MPLSKTEREAFLAEPHIAALAVEAGPDRGPLVIPIWYVYVPGGEPWVMTHGKARKSQLIRAAGRFSLMVEKSEPSNTYVAVEGSVSREENCTAEHLRDLSVRYVDPTGTEMFEMPYDILAESVVFYLRPERWLSSGESFG